MVDTDFAWRLTQGLVRIDSSDPGAYEGEIERYIKALVEERLAQQSRVFMHNIRFSFVLSRQAVRLPCSQSLG